jgi:hypothetical protein
LDRPLALVQQYDKSLFSSDSLHEQHAEEAKGQNEQAQAQETPKARTKKEQVVHAASAYRMFGM